MSEKITFLHPGNIGDCWAAIPAMREYYRKTGKKITVLLEKDRRAEYYEGATHPTKDENGNQVAKPLTEVSELTRSMINENNASAAKSRADAANGGSGNAGFKFTSSQRSKLIGATSGGFNDAKISAVEADLKKYGLEEVMKGFSTEEERTALTNALKGSDLAEQLAEYLKK